jgi:hypothetical protein
VLTGWLKKEHSQSDPNIVEEMINASNNFALQRDMKISSYGTETMVLKCLCQIGPEIKNLDKDS